MTKKNTELTYKAFEKAKKIVDAWKARVDAEAEVKNVAKLRSLIGKCYKYNNSYNYDEHWWLYVKIIDVKDSWSVQTENYEVTTRGVRIEQSSRPVYSIIKGGLGDNYKEISVKEFEKGRKEALEAMGIAIG